MWEAVSRRSRERFCLSFVSFSFHTFLFGFCFPTIFCFLLFFCSSCFVVLLCSFLLPVAHAVVVDEGDGAADVVIGWQACMCVCASVQVCKCASVCVYVCVCVCVCVCV